MTRLFITGVNRGIGKALKLEAETRGWVVTGTTRTGEAGTVPLTLDNPCEIPAQLADIQQIDVLINNAGVIGPDVQSPLKMDFAGFAETLNINSIAPLAVSQALLPALRKSKRPRILTLSSQMSWMGYRKSDRIAYRASKSAVNKLMQGLATDLEPENIPVALVDPGWVRTDMGGAEADQEPSVVAAGILDLVDAMSMMHTGRFYKFTGEERGF